MATSTQLRREILAGQWDEALCTLYGTEPAVLARQRQRYAAALEQFELYYGPGRQVHVYSAPGRAELGGNHTDHQHGYGLAAAVTLDLVAVASPSDDGFIRVKSRGFNKLDVIDLSEAEPQQGESTHSASLIRGIAEGFRAQGKTVGGFDAYTASDVLRGSGLSSSAAFEMGMAAILNGGIWLQADSAGAGEDLPVCGKYIFRKTQRPVGSADQRRGRGHLCGFCRPKEAPDRKDPHGRVAPSGHDPLRDRYPGQSQRADR